MAKRATQLLLLLFTLALVGCDHATKIGAKAALEGRAPRELLSGFMDLRYTENRDTAFSVFDRFHFPGKDILLISLSAVVLVAIVVAFFRRRAAASALELTGFAFVVAGAVGNLADRIARGYVVDFIHVVHWPVFNVADIAIVVGAALMFFSRFRAPTAARTDSPLPPFE